MIDLNFRTNRLMVCRQTSEIFLGTIPLLPFLSTNPVALPFRPCIPLPPSLGIPHTNRPLLDILHTGLFLLGMPQDSLPFLDTLQDILSLDYLD